MWCWLLPLRACKVPYSGETLLLCLFCLSAKDHPSFWRLLPSLAMVPASEASSVGLVSLTSFSLLPLLITLTWLGKGLWVCPDTTGSRTLISWSFTFSHLQFPYHVRSQVPGIGWRYLCGPLFCLSHQFAVSDIFHNRKFLNN